MQRSVYDDDKCAAIWTALVKKQDYHWRIDNSAKVKLSEILLEPFASNDDLFGNDLGSAVRLRDKLSSIMKGGDRVQATQVGVWIIADWGGIRSGKSIIPNWIESLSFNDQPSVLKFVDKMGTVRISSWSKILAFVDSQSYAIFDSRTSLALNAAMVRVHMQPKFFMPMPRGNKRVEAMKVINSKSESLLGGFEEYLFLLGRFVELGLAISILDAERTIFAAADDTAKKMLESH